MAGALVLVDRGATNRGPAPCAGFSRGAAGVLGSRILSEADFSSFLEWWGKGEP